MLNPHSLWITVIINVKIYICLLNQHYTTPMSHSISPPCLVPSGPPQGLAVANRTSTSIILTWRDPAPDRINDRDGVTGFAVKRNGQRVTTVTGRTYTFTGLSVATSYNFEVLAINEQGTAPNNHAAQLTASTASGGMYVHTYCTNGSVYACICLCSYLCHPLQCPTPHPCEWSFPGFPTPTWCGGTQSPLSVTSLVCRSTT